MRIDDVDWESWEPEQVATLLFVVKDTEVLLIHKKRGLGAGKINGPGESLSGEKHRNSVQFGKQRKNFVSHPFM